MLSGTFDPSLLFVMGGAVLVALPAFQLALRRSSGPLCAACYDLPAKTGVDAKLVSGALLFGAGWGECSQQSRFESRTSVAMHQLNMQSRLNRHWSVLSNCAAGLGGICPGPGLVALATLQPQALAFVAAMLVGMQLERVASTASVKLVGVPI